MSLAANLFCKRLRCPEPNSAERHHNSWWGSWWVSYTVLHSSRAVFFLSLSPFILNHSEGWRYRLQNNGVWWRGRGPVLLRWCLGPREGFVHQTLYQCCPSWRMRYTEVKPPTWLHWAWLKSNKLLTRQLFYLRALLQVMIWVILFKIWYEFIKMHVIGVSFPLAFPK